MLFRGPLINVRKTARLAVILASSALLPAVAGEKTGMPDLSQIDQTCLPTSTANLILWFGRHGYPKLIPAGASVDEQDLGTVHRLMQDTGARFDFGTRMDEVTTGIQKYIRESGYAGDVEYRGLDGTGPAFSQDWLHENDGANKGFVLFLAYCHWNPATQTATPAFGAGHAVTLVKAEPDMLLVHDPAHEDDETGRKILTPSPIAAGTWEDLSGGQSVAGLLFLSGSLLEAPPDSRVLLIGAVCVTMHPLEEKSVARESTSTSRAALGQAQAGLAPATSSPATVPWWNRIFESL